MSDIKLRHAERLAKASGSPEDEAALLRERGRVGAYAALTRECSACHGTGAEVANHRHHACKGTGRVPFLWRDRLELAAYCSHEGAEILLGGEDRCYACGRGGVRYTGQETRTGAARCALCLDLTAWLKCLDRWGCSVMVRAALAAGWAALAAWEGRPEEHLLGGGQRISGQVPGTWHFNRELDVRPRKALEAADNWLDRPCDEHRVACERIGALPDAFQALIAMVVLWGMPGRHSQGNGPAAFLVACRGFARLTSESAVRHAIQKELIAWALS